MQFSIANRKSLPEIKKNLLYSYLKEKYSAEEKIEDKKNIQNRILRKESEHLYSPDFDE